MYIHVLYKVVYTIFNRKLLYLPLDQSQVDITPLERHLQPHQGTPVEIVIINGYLCPYEVSSQLVLRQVAMEFADRVVMKEVSLTPETLQYYGDSRGIFINGKQKLLGGESEQAVRQAILEEL